MRPSLSLAVTMTALTVAVAPWSVAAPSGAGGTARPPNDRPHRRELPIEGAITDPDWIAKPSGQDFARFYPPLARNLGMPGRALISCVVSPLGILDRCKVVDEIPDGLEFGNAALALAPLFHMRPKTVDGVAVGGTEIRIPIRFSLAAADSPPPPPPPRFPAPTERSLALARRLIVAIGGPSLALAAKSSSEELRASLADDPPSTDAEARARALALDSLEQATVAASAKVIDAAARAAAATYSEAELAQVAGFAESPAGQAWFLHQGEAKAAEAAAMESVWEKIREDATARFCQKARCLAAPASNGRPNP